MSESQRSFQPSPAELLRANHFQARKAHITAVLTQLYSKPAPDPSIAVTAEEAELLKRVLDFWPTQGIRRNRYYASQHGAAHRAFLAMKERGLVTVIEDPVTRVLLCQATTLVITALRRAIETGQVA